jgi:hypothetical protein
MSNQKTKPSRWYYGLAALLPVLGCLITTAIIYRGFPNLPGALETIDIHNMTQVIVPGSADITFPKKGAYAVYYEYRSLVEGVQYINTKTPPPLICSLISKATGKEVGVTPEYIQGNTYSTKDRERVGVHILSISMTEPGTYTFSCHYPDEGTAPKVVAIGPNIVWELFNIVARLIAAILGGLVVLLGLGAIAFLVFIVVAFYRSRSTTYKKLKHK